MEMARCRVKTCHYSCHNDIALQKASVSHRVLNSRDYTALMTKTRCHAFPFTSILFLVTRHRTVTGLSEPGKHSACFMSTCKLQNSQSVCAVTDTD